MTHLAAFLLLLVSWTTLVSFAPILTPWLNLDAFVRVAPLACLVAATLAPRSWNAPTTLWIPFTAAAYVLLRLAWASEEADAANLLAGATALGFGLWLSWESGSRIRQLEGALEGIVGGSALLAEVDSDAGDAMGREMRRARRHGRPLSVVSLTPTDPIQHEELHRVVAEMGRSAVENYTDARLASLLVERIDAASVVARHGDHFVLLLTETDHTDAQQAVARIEHEFSKELGLALRCGISSFPDQETTLRGLLETSELEMRRAPAWMGSTETEPLEE